MTFKFYLYWLPTIVLVFAGMFALFGIDDIVHAILTVLIPYPIGVLFDPRTGLPTLTVTDELGDHR